MNRVYFLGAGAMKEAGVPLTSELDVKILERCRAENRQAPLRMLLEKLAPPRSSPLRKERPPIVDVLSTVDACIRDERPLDPDFRVDALRLARKALVVELYRAVTTRVGELIKIDPEAQLTVEELRVARERRVARYVKRFVRKLRVGAWDEDANRLHFPDSIITTTWDSTLDVALYEQVYAKGAGVTDLNLGSEFRDPYDDSDAFSNWKRPLCLLKLHGSTNWLHCPACRRIYVTAFIDSVSVLEGRNKKDRTCFCGFEPVEPVIVAPTVFQDIRNHYLSSIWSHAQQILEEAGEWIFSGYRFPPEDIAVRTLLRRAFWSRRDQGRRTVILVVHPSKGMRPVVARCESLFGRKVQALRCGFRAFVEQKMTS